MRRTASPGFRRASVAGLAAACLVAVLPACTSSGPSSQRATASASRPRSVGQITAAAAGPIRPGTIYSQAGLKAAAPGFTVTSIETANEASTVSAYGLFYDGMQTFQAFKGGPGGTVGEVHGVGDRVVGPAGERIGMSFAEAGTRPSECRLGRNLWTGMAICTSHGARNVQLVYSIPGYMDFTHMPPPSELREAMLQRIIWRPN